MEGETNYLKISNDGLKKELMEHMQHTYKTKDESHKQEETVAYMFARTKNLSALISNFYAHFYGSTDPAPSKQENVLSFETIQTKLERIFKDYETLAKKPKRFDFSTDVGGMESAKSGFNSLNNTKDKRSVSNNIAPKAESIFRSKSPAPTYNGNIGYLEQNNGLYGNRVWNEQHRLK